MRYVMPAGASERKGSHMIKWLCFSTVFRLFFFSVCVFYPFFLKPLLFIFAPVESLLEAISVCSVWKSRNSFPDFEVEMFAFSLVGFCFRSWRFLSIKTVGLLLPKWECSWHKRSTSVRSGLGRIVRMPLSFQRMGRRSSWAMPDSNGLFENFGFH